eukprot:768713-Hanusia_phi.AAC.4
MALIVKHKPIVTSHRRRSKVVHGSLVKDTVRNDRQFALIGEAAAVHGGELTCPSTHARVVGACDEGRKRRVVRYVPVIPFLARDANLIFVRQVRCDIHHSSRGSWAGAGEHGVVTGQGGVCCRIAPALDRNAGDLRVGESSVCKALSEERHLKTCRHHKCGDNDLD